MSTPTRRSLLAGAAGLAAAPAAVSAKGMVTMTIRPADAELIALAARFIQHERAIQAMPCDALPNTLEADVQDAEQRQWLDVQRSLTLQLGTLRATTAEGIAARARCLAVHNAEGAFSMDDPDTTTGRLLRYLMRDAGALGGLVPAPAVSPDAELLEACAAFDDLERAYIAQSGAWPCDSPEADAAEAERDRLAAALEPFVDRMCELQAVTREGQAARARSLALWDAELMKPGKVYTNDRLTTAIVRDLLAR